MQDFEKLGAFYLGRLHDLEAGSSREGLLLYDSKDLVTHAVCVGMTGSGKTGLCIALLEEAAIDGIPALVIDPKGDLTNLLLTFPDLRPDDFLPWINQDDARRKGMTGAEYAQQQAELWRSGLESWGQDGDRIRRLRAAADFCVYTPGSEAGRQISILDSFAAPAPVIRQDADLLRERVATAVTSILSLLGIDADPIRSREHILLSTILGIEWSQGRGLDLGRLIQLIQTPPVSRIGVMDLESFFPSKDRFELAMSLNNLLAAPGFQAWMDGDPLDIQRMLYTESGQPRITVFSIAHLPDAERMFFVTMLLNETLGWMRTQSGTTSLRALLYMDEIFGYFPPTANPPSKAPLLTLMKQARAFGLGVVLSTQNPVDLDYKGLSNAGTWFVGRLQTERDKTRLLDGLEGTTAGGSEGFDRDRLERTLSGLGKRVFLMHNVHESAPEVFETRWVMSYLRGPLTRDQIRTLMAARAGDTAPAPTTTPAAPAPPAAATPTPTAAVAPPPAPTTPALRPVLPPDVPQVFLPVRRPAMPGASLVYAPKLVATGSVYYIDAKVGVDTDEPFTLLLEPDGGAQAQWENAEPAALGDAELLPDPPAAGSFLEVPDVAAGAASYPKWQRSLTDWLYRNRQLELFRNATFKAHSRPGESEADFRTRVRDLSREERDLQVEKLRQKYGSKLQTLQNRLLTAQQRVDRESEQARQQKVQTAISLGATLMSMFASRKKISQRSVGRATTTLRGVGRSRKEADDIRRAEESVEVIQQQIADVEAEAKTEIDELAARLEEAVGEIETIAVKPKKMNVAVRRLALGWAPFWRQPDGRSHPAWS